ncbi:hypothetical protein MSSIT_1225 [Methanosarcina siciliae T4/M]|uniref:Uncharacterized protein n=1 Tax=Methanosarcina siciliae T4/M TaxID=1434120 RepID=A0A0E3P367_9EURY|nr:hypothetical protein MSSIT_1225 [Methanosarcina siciliae T4/M]
MCLCICIAQYLTTKLNLKMCQLLDYNHCNGRHKVDFKRIIPYIQIVLILIAAIIVFIVIDENEKGNAALTVIAIVAAILSLQQSIEANQKTEKALKLTEKTLKLTETEQKIRDLEKRLDLFYYPVYDYLTPITSLGFGNLNDKRADFTRALSFRYLAIGDTKEKLEKFLDKKGKTKEDSSEMKEVLKNDISTCEKAIQEYQKIIDKLNS